jgi:hypothetical protein
LVRYIDIKLTLSKCTKLYGVISVMSVFGTDLGSCKNGVSITDDYNRGISKWHVCGHYRVLNRW